MNKLKIKVLSLTLALLFYNFCLSQFNKAVDDNPRSGVIFINNNNEILHGYSEVITKLDLSGNILWSKELLPFTDNGISHESSFTRISRFLDTGEFLFTNALSPLNLNKISFSKLNSRGMVDFTRLMKYSANYSIVSLPGIQKIPKSIELDSGNHILLSHLSDPEKNNYYYSFIKFNDQGDPVWHKDFKDLLPGTPITIINKLNESNIALIRNGRFDLNNEEPHVENIIQILNENFTELKTIQIDGMVEKIIHKNNHYYILVFRYGFRDSQTNLTNSLICLNQDFEPIWAKEYIPSSQIIHLTFSKNDSGFLMSESTGLNSKMNLIALDNNGNVLNSKILATPFSSRAPSVSNNYFAHEGSDFRDPTQPQLLSCFSNTLESLQCYSPNDCIEVINFDAKINIIEDFFLEPINLDIEFTDAVIETVDYKPNYFDFCNEDFLDFPAPLFSVPDTVCINESISVSNLQNENAESANWLLPESSIEYSSLANPTPFSYSTPGTYTITQQVTFRGCTNEYSRDIVVVAPISTGFKTEIILCDQVDFIINAEHNLAKNYTWDNGDTTSQLLINQEGVFSLILTDKFCSQTIDFNVSYFDYDLIDPNFIQDTAICLQRPLSLGDEFINDSVLTEWKDGSLEYPRSINESGFYSLTTTLNECSTVNHIYIKADDCKTQFYFPSAFSPNKDGINDTIFPLGNDFEILNFIIYDKWGNMVHDNINPWNGDFRGRGANIGVYTYQVNLLNLRLNEVESFSGNFTLIK